MRRSACIALIVFLLVLPATARATTWLVPPVDAAIVQRFLAPETDYARGHRGVDYAAAAGTKIGAAADGEVTFAGSVAGANAITIEHGGSLETTYSQVGDIFVTAGESVTAGTWIGTVDRTHPGGPAGLHFGVKVAEDYVDPLSMIGPVDVGTAVHLVPVYEPPLSLPDAARALFPVPSRDADPPPCRPLSPVGKELPPPNDNIAVAVAGIGSRTAGAFSAAMYESGPELLGYPSDRIYRFSYSGTDGPELHRPYPARATFGDLRVAAERLRWLLLGIAVAHPGTAVDVIAHSQGGVVARRALEELQEEWSPDLPRVDHLITFSTPHEGAPAADAIAEFKDGFLGRVVTTGIERVAGDRLPDPDSLAVAQLRPSSEIIRDLAREDVSYGTRFLALATAQDPVVTANVALPEDAQRRVVPLRLAEWLNAHNSVISSDLARSIAYGFLRDAPPTCKGTSDARGPVVGRALGWIERRLGGLGTLFERRLGLRA